MSKLNIAPTKSNLLKMKSQLSVSQEGYDLLEQKREILVMELMHMVEQVKMLERDIDKIIATAYPSLRNMLMAAGGDKIEMISRSVQYNFTIHEKPVTIAGMKFSSIDVELPARQLFYSFLGTLSDSDKVMIDFFQMLNLLTKMAAIRTIVWKLSSEVKKTQRRVNALDRMIIPQTKQTAKYIEDVLEERERNDVFVLKSIKGRKNKQGT